MLHLPSLPSAIAPPPPPPPVFFFFLFFLFVCFLLEVPFLYYSLFIRETCQLMCSMSPREPMSHRFSSLCTGIKFKSLVLDYRTATDSAPSHLHSLLSIYIPSRRLQSVQRRTYKIVYSCNIHVHAILSICILLFPIYLFYYLCFVLSLTFCSNVKASVTKNKFPLNIPGNKAHSDSGLVGSLLQSSELSVSTGHISLLPSLQTPTFQARLGVS